MTPTEFRPGMYEGITPTEAGSQVGTNSDGQIYKQSFVAIESGWQERTNWAEIIGTEKREKRKWNEKPKISSPG